MLEVTGSARSPLEPASLAESPRSCLGRAVGAVFLVLLRDADAFSRLAFSAVAVSGLCYLATMFGQLLPPGTLFGLHFHGFWEMFRRSRDSWLHRIPEVAEGLLDGFQGLTVLLVLRFLSAWPEIWRGRGAPKLADCQRKVRDPRRLHVRRLWALFAALWVLHVALDALCQRDRVYAALMVVCSLGFDLAANTFIWALWHEKILFKLRVKMLRREWTERRDAGDFAYDGYRDDYVGCSEELEEIAAQWSKALGAFALAHFLEVALRVVQLFFMASLKFDVVVYDYLLVCGQLLVYVGRLFIVLFWAVEMNAIGDELQSFIRCRLSPGTGLNLDFLVQLAKECPVSFCVLGVRPTRTEVTSLLVAVVGSVASGAIGNVLSG